MQKTEHDFLLLLAMIEPADYPAILETLTRMAEHSDPPGFEDREPARYDLPAG